MVAEGVETQEQLDWVVERDIEQFQGYLFARPLPPNELLALLVAVSRAESAEYLVEARQKKLF